ncbi:hypothetical protein [Hyalangium sp.]|uniref:hypothetical protein n=1 Tax=Hyalangium sp. TaxID=2028555 RepID=UPI002D6F175B|nr:hypothetical protein [Hyalangium sp.]HYH96103.1 hypothetical protein [Hyalangium sp.]
MFTRLLLLGVLVMGAVGQAEEATRGGKPTGGQFCGGIAAIPCPEGLSCVDDPKDSCDPTQGGADCGGVCVDPYAEKKPKCDYRDPNLSYVSRDPAQCAAILFKCPEGSTAFFNDCGCGCQNTQGTCNYQDPNRRYVSQAPAQCATLRFVCNTGESAFFDDCGCGCQLTPTP